MLNFESVLPVFVILTLLIQELDFDFILTYKLLPNRSVPLIKAISWCFRSRKDREKILTLVTFGRPKYHSIVSSSYVGIMGCVGSLTSLFLFAFLFRDFLIRGKPVEIVIGVMLSISVSVQSCYRDLLI